MAALAKTKNGKSNAIDPAAAPSPRIPLGGGFGRDLANWLFPVFLGVILIGFYLIWKFGSAAGNPNSVRALFIAMNAATLSGFTENPGVGGLNPFGQFISLMLIIAGSLFTMIVGGLAVIRITRMRFSDIEVINTAIAVECLALLIGTSLLWVDDRTTFQATFLAATSFGNCGLYVADPPPASDAMVHAVVLPLSILGGVGIPVIMELWCMLVFHKKISEHSRTTIAGTAWLYIVGLVLIFLLNQSGHGWPTLSVVRTGLPQSSVLSIESRTGGLAVAHISDLTQPAKWFLVPLMAIGAGSGGTASGLKITTLVVLICGVKKLLRSENPGRPFAIAVSWLGIYIILVLAAVLLLAYVSGTDPADNILLNATSAMSNVGFSASPVQDQKSLFFAYSAIILVGRMAPLMVLWWMAETTADGELAVG
jgi:trk system potassium uptake protein TrkH